MNNSIVKVIQKLLLLSVTDNLKIYIYIRSGLSKDVLTIDIRLVTSGVARLRVRGRDYFCGSYKLISII